MNQQAFQYTFQQIHSVVNHHVWLLVEHGISKPIFSVIDQGEDEFARNIGFGKRIFLYVQYNPEEANKQHIIKVLKS